MLVNGTTIKLRAKELSSILMEISLKEISNKTKQMVMVHTRMLMGRSISVRGKRTSNTVREVKYLLMEAHMLDPLRVVSRAVLEHSNGLMAQSTVEHGPRT